MAQLSAQWNRISDAPGSQWKQLPYPENLLGVDLASCTLTIFWSIVVRQASMIAMEET
jgi:hypothetical protein